MIPRGTPDIGWCDLIAGLTYFILPTSAKREQDQVESIWSSREDCVACLSVRSGFDLALRALAFPPGSEILVSAITIPDMVRLLEAHQLVPVPLNVDHQTLAVDPQAVARAITPRTKAILIAHLFGSRMPLDAIANVALKYGLVLFEDCAQAYDGSDYRGNACSDVSMFSFGSIKTATALGGGLLRFRDRELLSRVRSLQENYVRQSHRRYFQRLVRFYVLKLLATTTGFGLLAMGCGALRMDLDGLLRKAVRGFSGSDWLSQVRQLPCGPLLRMLNRRLRQVHSNRVQRRVNYAGRILSAIPPATHIGSTAWLHSHWVLPVASRDPDGLIQRLRKNGFDATRSASSMTVVGINDLATQPPIEAATWFRGVVYLPMYPHMSNKTALQLAAHITDFEINDGHFATNLSTRFPPT